MNSGAREQRGGVFVVDNHFAQIAIEVVRDQRVSISARLLYAVLKTFSNVKEREPDNPRGSSFVSKRRLAVEMGKPDAPVTTRSIEKWLAELEAAGYLTVDRRTRTGRLDGRVNLPNRYFLDDGLSPRPRVGFRGGPQLMTDDWEPTPGMVAYARDRGLADELGWLIDEFRHRHIEDGRPRVKWEPAWRAYIRYYKP